MIKIQLTEQECKRLALAASEEFSSTEFGALIRGRLEAARFNKGMMVFLDKVELQDFVKELENTSCVAARNYLELYNIFHLRLQK